MTQRRRICIVGGGPAGLAAALSLTDPTTHPNWQEEYDVVVLQLGWRAGGKGATGRRGTSHWVSDGAGGGEWQLRGDARVEEHGIHLFGNCDNALITNNTITTSQESGITIGGNSIDIQGMDKDAFTAQLSTWVKIV